MSQPKKRRGPKLLPPGKRRPTLTVTIAPETMALLQRKSHEFGLNLGRALDRLLGAQQ